MLGGSVRGTYANETFEKLRQHIRSGKINLIDACKEYDPNETGKISIIEFRGALKKLNIGLTSIEVDQLMDFLNVDQKGMVDWKSFVNRMYLK
jgi:Ca2+-binding protein (EF-Hand superfamily)